MKPTTREITTTLQAIEAANRNSGHPRSLARKAVGRYRQGTAVSPAYDFSTKSPELKQIVYDAAVRFSRRRWWSKLLR